MMSNRGQNMCQGSVRAGGKTLPRTQKKVGSLLSPSWPHLPLEEAGSCLPAHRPDGQGGRSEEAEKQMRPAGWGPHNRGPALRSLYPKSVTFPGGRGPGMLGSPSRCLQL